MFKLINIRDLVEAAKARGFHATLFNGGSYAEIHDPNEPTEGNGWHNGAQYISAKAFVINDGGETGYGYNHWFHGPFHPGLARVVDFGGIARLLAHPAMRDYAESCGCTSGVEREPA